jgi:peptidoglycan LD-endopeptidase LytH
LKERLNAINDNSLRRSGSIRLRRSHFRGPGVPVLLVALAAITGSKPVAAQVKESGPSADTAKSPVVELREKGLLFPVADLSIEGLRDTFREPRSGSRIHNAIDIPAPRGQPVLSTDSGRVLKLHRSAAGGLMVYTTDASERFIYYYAHLDRYRSGLREGTQLARGDTIGFVGTTGNAPANVPHLHFAILRSSNITRWSRGTPVNPFKVFTKQ